MQKQTIQHPAIMLIGITTQTNNTNESDTASAKIALTVQTYFHEGLAHRIQNRQNPGVTYSVYTNYASDASGEYTYFIGEVVTDLTDAPQGLTAIHIPQQRYVKFTNGPAKMPDVCIQAWRDIWQMTPSDLGGERAYIADFEIYDERAQDPAHTELDIYVGIQG